MMEARTYADATAQEVEKAAMLSWQAFQSYKKKDLKERAAFLRAIAAQMEMMAEEVIQTAHQETHLAEGRLQVEWKRTLFQLTSYAQACEEGAWLDIRIDTANPDRKPPKPDLRKMLVPLGPVVVFGASNFPFAYSTAGGDTACALAAGCPVIIKAHPAHAHTSELVAGAAQRAACQCGLPEGVFQHLHGASFEVGKALVQHPKVQAVGFTGSYSGGKALMDLAAARKVPIPVFAEMGSINPVFLLPEKLKGEVAGIAALYHDSITQSAGQFCTNPGLIVGVESKDLNEFIRLLGEKIRETRPVPMLHPGIARNFHTNRARALEQAEVTVAAQTLYDAGETETIPTIARVDASDFLNNPVLHQEVFGPYSLVVQCRDAAEMLQVAEKMEGQLTASLWATEEEVAQYCRLVEAMQGFCGRFVLNGVPTGVEVALAMHHGGPFPATSDSRFTAVGADGIRRFARPVCFQNWPSHLLPAELQNENPLGLWRTVNNRLTREPV